MTVCENFITHQNEWDMCAERENRIEPAEVRERFMQVYHLLFAASFRKIAVSKRVKSDWLYVPGMFNTLHYQHSLVLL